jgi:hypothetical protein
MSNPWKKRKIGDEQRWESDYFITNTNGKLQCVLCMHDLSVPKEYNVKRYYTSLHEEKLKKYEGASRTTLLEDYKKKLKQQNGVFTKVLKTQTSGLTASYAVALELAKPKKPFSYGMLVKQCAVEMTKAFEYNNMVEKFQSAVLSHQTV